MVDFVIKIGSGTTPAKAANAIVMHLLTGDKVYIDTIGVAANYVASKAFVLTLKSLQQKGISVAYRPTFKDVSIKKEIKTVISWEVIVL